MTTEDNHKLHAYELKVLAKKRLHAQKCIRLYQAWISKAFDEKVKKWVFKQSVLVLVMWRPMAMIHKSKDKFQLNQSSQLY